jgi:hypothetical protein
MSDGRTGFVEKPAARSGTGKSCEDRLDAD